jgi:hypothetical protein
MTTKHAENRPIDMTTKHAENRPVDMTTKHVENRPIDMTTKHAENRPIDMTTKHAENRPIDMTTKHAENRPIVCLLCTLCKELEKKICSSCLSVHPIAVTAPVFLFCRNCNIVISPQIFKN